jgi:hypothetical protein
MRVVAGKDGWPSAYAYSAGGATRTLSQEPAPIPKVLHLALFHPLDDHYGLAPLEAAQTSMDIHNAAARWNKALLDNAARPSGALVYSAQGGQLTPDQFARLKAELEQGFAGAANAGRPMVLEGGLDWRPMSWTGLVEGLLRVGVTDIPLGRLVEGHVDALRILDQARAEPHAGARYGVWASRSAGTGIAARVEGATLRLNGTIRFASGAGVIDRALVPVWSDPETHLLVDLAVDDLPVDRSHWTTAAMRVSQSHTVTVADLVVDATDVVGEPSFYLGRPGFLPGGVGVAAVWAGGLTRVLDVTVAMLDGRRVTEA